EISTQIHLSSAYSLASAWDEVEQTADKHPDPAIGRWLKDRALAGRVRATKEKELLPMFWKLIEDFQLASVDFIDQSERARAEQLAASICAALESLIETAEAEEKVDLTPSPILMEAFASKLNQLPASTDLIVSFFSLRMRALSLQEREYDLQLLTSSLSTIVTATSPSPLQSWLDWNLPSSLIDRLRLQLLISSANTDNEEHHRIWQQEALTRLNLIDAERLVSLILRRQLSKSPVSASELEELLKHDLYYPSRRPTGVSHRVIPPLIVTIAQGYLALGQPSAALSILEKRRLEAVQSAQDQDTLRELDLAIAVVIWRMRLPRHARTFASRMRSSNHPRAQTLIELVEAII